MLIESINWNANPEIIKLFGIFPIRYYGLLFASGLLISYKIVAQIYKREHIPLKNLENLTLYIFIGTILGARLGHCLFYEPVYYFKHPFEIFLPLMKVNGHWTYTGFRGLASHGGVLGVLLAIFFYSRKTKTSFLWILDRIAVVGGLAGAFIRLGNFMNSEIIGKPSNSDFGIIFQKVDSIPRHPAQLYEAGAYLIIFILLYILYKKTPNRKDGYIFGIFLILLFTARFVIEFFKIIQVGFENSMILNMGQLLSIPFIIIGIALVFYTRR